MHESVENLSGLCSREWHIEPCMLGIDEAGRGPVLGPMVYGCAFCPVSYSEQLAEREFVDSKTLTESKREKLFEILKNDNRMGWSVDVIEACDISAQMLRQQKRSLNAISYESAMGLISQALDKGVNVTKVFVDTVGDPEKYEDMLRGKFQGIEFAVRKKADSLFPIVSAASIAAKVTRDRRLQNWVMQEEPAEAALVLSSGADVSEDSLADKSSVFSKLFGSGYPGDPATKAWLLKHREPVFGFPSLVRFSWSTARTLLENEAAASVFWEGDADEEEKGGYMSRRRVAGKVEFESSAPDRHPYFRTRKLQPVTIRL